MELLYWGSKQIAICFLQGVNFNEIKCHPHKSKDFYLWYFLMYWSSATRSDCAWHELLCYAKSLQSFPTLWTHRRQPTRLPRPWDSPGKNNEVGCHFLLQCVISVSVVTQSCPTLSDPVDCSLTGSSVHGIFQARVLEWGAIAFSVTWISAQQIFAHEYIS